MTVESQGSSTSALPRLVMAVAASGSLAAMFIVGRHQRSIVLMAVFTVWVLSPYAALALLDLRSSRWPGFKRRLLQRGTLLISFGALATYAYVLLRPLKSQPASTFLIVPFVSWIALAVGAAIAAASARRG